MKGAVTVNIFWACLLWISMWTFLRADEVVFYSLPEEKVNSEFTRAHQWATPLHQIILLNGDWDLKHPGSDSTFGTIRVPCIFRNTNAIHIEKQFTVKKAPGAAYMLYAGMINGQTEIRLNDSLVYQGSRSYVPISLPLPSNLIHDGENVIRLTIRRPGNRFGTTPAFFPINIPRIDTGILDGIYLEILPPLSISGVTTANAFSDSLITIHGAVDLTRSMPDTTSFSLFISLMNSEGVLFRRSLKIDQPHITQMKLPAIELPVEGISRSPFPSYWIEALLDSAGKTMDFVRKRLALRMVQSDGRGVSVNGLIKIFDGVNYVYQTPEGTGLFDPALVKKDLEDIKKRGFNTIHVILHPMPEEFYRLCDEVGLLCLQDLPFVTTSVTRKALRQTLGEWQEYYLYLQKMAASYNSIAGLGVGFYMDNQSNYEQQVLQMFLQQLPPSTVPLYVSTLLPGSRANDRVDFLLINLIHSKRLTEDFTRLQNSYTEKPFYPLVFSKTGSAAVWSPEVSGTDESEFQFYQQLKANRLPGHIPGHFVLTYNDFYEELPSVSNGYQQDVFLNPMGLVTLNRQAKQSIPPNANSSREVQQPETEHPSQANVTQAYLYILVGIFNLFIFLIPFKRFKIFRQNILYSIKKPHGFFVNLQERIYIPYRQSFFLLLVISVNGALVLGSIAYFYRDNLLFDYLLSLLIPRPELKGVMVKLIWNQTYFLVAGTLGIVALFHLLALLMRGLTLFGYGAVRFGQVLAVSIWAAAPFVILLPLGIFMYTIMLTMKSYWIFFAFLLYFHVLYYFRWINGARVLMIRLYSRVFITVTLLVFIILFGGGYFFQHFFNGWEYLQYAYHLYGIIH